MGQIQGGLSSAIRLAQGERVSLKNFKNILIYFKYILIIKKISINLDKNTNKR
jgi:hypothetical protein